jgi:hypothetical protein
MAGDGGAPPLLQLPPDIDPNESYFLHRPTGQVARSYEEYIRLLNAASKGGDGEQVEGGDQAAKEPEVRWSGHNGGRGAGGAPPAACVGRRFAR